MRLQAGHLMSVSNLLIHSFNLFEGLAFNFIHFDLFHKLAD